MSKPTEPNDGLNDDDIRALLHSKNSTTPKAVDHAILSAAREAVANTKETQAMQGSREIKRWHAYWPQGLSAAAVVVLAVVLVPLIVSTPESSFESSLASDQDLVLGEEIVSRKESAVNAVAESAEIVAAGDLMDQALGANRQAEVEAIVKPDSRANAEPLTMSNSDGLAQRKSRPASSNAPVSIAADSMEATEVASGLQRSADNFQYFNSQEGLLAVLNDSSYTSEGDPVWRLFFDGNKFRWIHLNRQYQGTYKFVDDDTFNAQLNDRTLTVKFSEKGLLWDGVLYQRD